MHDGLDTRERREGRHMDDGLRERGERADTCMMAY